MSFDILGKDIAVLFILAMIFGVATYISYGGAAFYLFCGQISGDYFTIQEFLKKHKKHKTRAQKKRWKRKK